jgi:hypothetical protein
MSFRSVFFAGLLAAGLFGCGKQPEPRHIVLLPDVSGSIDRQALGQAFKAIDDLVGHLHRGDRIAIIPILGDAEAQVSGRIIRFEVPTNRQAYDSDLKVFRQKLKTSLATMEAEAVAHPGAKTDILGSVALAAQEFESTPNELDKKLVILTDFIQEDREVDFRKDHRLGSKSNASDFAAHTIEAQPLNFSHAQVYLGLLRSNEYNVLSKHRREALREFWTKFFKSCGGNPKFTNDGAGLIESSVSW